MGYRREAAQIYMVPESRWTGRRDGRRRLIHVEGKALEACEAVINCAGERNAETIQGFVDELGMSDIVATTPYTGESTVTAHVLQPLHGKTVVFQTGDNDETGQTYIPKCTRWLAAHVKDLHILRAPEGLDGLEVGRGHSKRLRDIASSSRGRSLYTGSATG
jgi:hypothetical protein